MLLKERIGIHDLLKHNQGDVVMFALGDLGALAKKGDKSAIDDLILYANKGMLDFRRSDALCELAELVKGPDPQWAKRFKKWLSDPALTYWTIPAYLRAGGPAAYRDVINVANDITKTVEVRAQAVKCLAVASKQPFDRGLDPDPGNWQLEDLRLIELADWAKAGFPVGKKYPKPKQHPALSRPRTPLERSVARLVRMLAEARGQHHDLALPRNWLVPAAPDAMRQVNAQWDLPATYVDFLTRFSPLRMCIVDDRFDGLILFGAAELIEAQHDYTHNTDSNKRLADWPDHYVLVGSLDLDPFALDLSKSDGNDAPVLTAQHGIGYWKFKRKAPSFLAFLQWLVR